MVSATVSRGDSISKRSKWTTTSPIAIERAAVGVGRLLAPAPPAQQAADARQQLVETERLGQIVVGAFLEAAHQVLRVVLRGEDQDRHVVARGARAAQHLDAVHLGQHQVEDHELEAARGIGQPARGGGAVARDLDRVALRREIEAQTLGQMRLVVDHQDPRHRGPPYAAGGAARSVTTKRLPVPRPSLRATTLPP